MAIDIYLQIDGIKGEATGAQHQGDIQVNSFQWGESEVTSGGGGAGGGGATGKTVVGNLTVHVNTSSASPKLFLACATGEHFKKAVLTVEKASGGHATPFLTITLQDVLIASFAIAGDHAAGLPTETVSLNFTKIEWQYTPQKPDGTSGPPVKAGWDIKQMKPF